MRPRRENFILVRVVISGDAGAGFAAAVCAACRFPMADASGLPIPGMPPSVHPMPQWVHSSLQFPVIVDSTALPEQVTRDAIVSAFQSAGQRCSALRVLFIQEDVAGRGWHGGAVARVIHS